MANPGAGRWVGITLTVDHKPDTPTERARIEGSGGSVAYLADSNYKPFIRGGDFLERKARGEKVYQLQYSRAFGGKDLKPFGLSCDPDVTQVQLSGDHRVLIIASDGLWDVCSDADAVEIARQAREAGRDAAQTLIEYSLAEQDRRNGIADNTTVLCLFW
eukprot:TRINITY_DN14849_c0_g1_i1.p1 TRINITY_DN14849_c0_g1~~TRINITY_DN14849_c0_g1_i1.p1  ORF type:complete len:160 (-),score=38.03 TRINITY_DN14849_c0_g1_i1:23-502(-)